MYVIGIIIAVVLLLRICEVHSEVDVLVNTPGGIVRGSKIKTRKGADIFAFHGLRYAESPTGRNRFKPPVPVKNWTGVYNATQEGVACYQLNPHPSYIISEDCLFLDVFTKSLNSSLPVIVFIHGGGFVVGAKSDVSPDYLLDKDIVLASLNYRLHAFGFFSTGTSDVPGNNGLKDQNLALKWIKHNIRAFGGNPEMVTLVGHSAGSLSATLHLVSPISNRLFHRIIAMSGSTTSHIKTTTRHWSNQLLKLTSCNNINISIAIDCLRRVPVEDITKKSNFGNQCQMLTWNYDIEPKSSDKSFVIEDPTKSLKDGSYRRVPIMAGISHDEFKSMAYSLQSNSKLFNELSRNFSGLAPHCFLYNEYGNKNQISRLLKKFYLNDKNVSAENIDSLGKIYADAIIGHGMHRFLSLAKQVTSLFFYRFDFIGRYSHSYKPNGKPLGVIHGDELQYIFVFKKIAPLIKVTDPENIMVERMTTWWSQFAATGDPNDYHDGMTNKIRWLPTTKNRVIALYINSNSTLSGEPYSDRYKLWDNAFPLTSTRNVSKSIETLYNFNN